MFLLSIYQTPHSHNSYMGIIKNILIAWPLRFENIDDLFENKLSSILRSLLISNSSTNVAWIIIIATRGLVED